MRIENQNDSGPGSNSELRNPSSALAIVGIGCLFPKAAGTGFFWANCKNGVDGITDVPPTHWNPDDYFDPDPKKPDMTYARRGGFLSAVDFNPLEFGIAPRDLEATDTSQLLGLVAAKQALNDSGIQFDDAGTDATPKRRVSRSRVSVILGVTGTLELVIPLGARLGHPRWKRAMKAAGIPDGAIEDASQRIAESYVPWQENSFPGLLGNVVAGRIANKLDLHGTNCVVDAACASSLSAIHLAGMELQTGRADVVVTGGADTFNDIFMYMCFSKTPALSPTGNSKPFDATGDGTILGEGIGVVVLKRLADAERDGDTIYAVLRGMGTSSDGKGNAIYAPSADGQKRCLLSAYEQAGVSPDTIELVEAHGTGTKVGDAIEATALAEVFRGETKTSVGKAWCALGSVKSQIGHTKAAAGAAGIIKAALALHYKVLPPTLKVTKPVDPLSETDSPFYVNAEKRPWLPRPEHPRRAALSAFGFGGSNFHCVLEEHGAKKSAVDWDGTVEILALCGTRAEVAAALNRVPRDWNAFARTAEQTRASFDRAAECRLLLVAHRESTNLVKLLANAKAALESDPAATAWQTPDGAIFGSGPVPGKLGVLFPGQGAGYPGMLRDLACLFPELLDALDAANRAFATQGEVRRLSDLIYPPSDFTSGAKERQESALRATDVAQPAIGAVSIGAWLAVASRFGLDASAFGGHSYGELPALAAAGRIGLGELFILSRLRGRLMGHARPGDPGLMLAVMAPTGSVQAVITECKAQVVIANKNAPAQTVLSGPTVEIEKVERAFAGVAVRTVRLPVAAAFHSPFVADAAGPFREALSAVEIRPGAAPVFANTTGKEYPADADATRDLLGRQLAHPVEFVAQIRAMHAAGVRTILEVGPGQTLARLVDPIAADAQYPLSDIVAFAIDSSGGGRSGVLDLAWVLARLSARGHAVRLSGWEEGSRCRPPAPPTKAGLVVPICGANYVTTRPARPPVATVSPPAGAPAAPWTPPMTDPALAQALQTAQQTLLALQRMQDQTALLHKQFLDSQETAQKTLASLVAQQQTLFAPAAAAPAFVKPDKSDQTQLLPTPAPRTVPTPPTGPSFTPKPEPIAPALPVPNSPAASIGRLLLDVVAEKTGYPADMLDLAMTLDADLGIDSIKRVEILSALQEKIPDAPPVKPEHLGTLRTLGDVVAYLSGTGEFGEDGLPVTIAMESLPRLVETLNRDNPSAAAVLLDVVAEKTGYPADMLDLAMSLDADLGIDSIKRVEILSALQEKIPDAPAVKPEHLGSLRTLQDVVNLMAVSGLTDSAPRTQKIPIVPTQPSDGIDSKSESDPDTVHVSKIRQAKLSDAIVSSTSQDSNTIAPAANRGGGADGTTTSFPTDQIDRSTLQPVDLDLGTPRPRVPLPEGKDVLVVSEEDAFSRAVVRLLTAHGFAVKVSPWSAASAAVPSDGLAGLILLAPAHGADPHLCRRGFLWLQRLGPKLRQTARTAGAAAVLTVARLDGGFGLSEELAETTDPASGGLAGLIKTVRYEWPELTCKAADLSPAYAEADPTAAAAAVVDEFLFAGPVEVGIAATHRCLLELARTVRRPAAQPLPIGPKDVLIVTGGARGVTAEAAVALAEASRATLVLTGRTPAPTGSEPEWAVGITDEAEMKKAIAKKLGSGATPKAISEQFAKLAGQRDIRATIARVEAVGGKAAYYSVDVSSGKAVADLLQQVRAKFGPITGLIHGAGVLADRRIETLTAEQFDLVYRTKVHAARVFLDLLRDEQLKVVVLFSSTTARFGRVGQVAYASANEVLNKLAQVESRRRPSSRVVAINWGPWDGGMVTPALRKMFEAEGVGLIPLAEGGAFLVNELIAGGTAVEVTAVGKFRGPAVHTGSGLIPGSAVIRMNNTPAPNPYQPPTAPPAPELSLAFERTVDVASHPIVRSHVLDGRAVLPMALHLEWLAHAALHGNPGFVFHGFDNLRIAHGVMIEDGTPLTLRALAGKAQKQDKNFVVPVELRGRRRDGRDVIHSRAEIVLTSVLPKPPTADKPPAVQPYPHPIDEVYKYFLFHGPDLHGIERVEGLSETGFLGTAYPAPAPAEWFADPLRASWVAEPLVLDASFQMMILWSFAQHGAGSLPCFAGRYRQYRRSFPAGTARVSVRITRDNGTFARADIDYLDADGIVIAQLQDYECVMDPGLNQAFRRNQLAMRVPVKV
ncbi:MAG TPA: SDR family NAD(P)-dependent oxidoreductase [Fimbriiglobus sp.]|jgi:acyl transferase domain-containing protein/NAD(P)-dependent dehydrogenase (short-subunit alcohol dehydrogenase family)/acyl carrier protein